MTAYEYNAKLYNTLILISMPILQTAFSLHTSRELTDHGRSTPVGAFHRHGPSRAGSDSSHTLDTPRTLESSETGTLTGEDANPPLKKLQPLQPNHALLAFMTDDSPWYSPSAIGPQPTTLSTPSTSNRDLPLGPLSKQWTPPPRVSTDSLQAPGSNTEAYAGRVS